MKIVLSQDEVLSALRAWIAETGLVADRMAITLHSSRPRGSEGPVITAEVDEIAERPDRPASPRRRKAVEPEPTADAQG